jgi:16S rRNA (adenine1518-N6/adenine1519-N6)-dimethyltransferase
MTTPRKILESRGIRPLKRLGQSFLGDRNIIGKIIGILDIRCDDVVIEIGAGIGIMTEEIARYAGRVIAIEIDPYMVKILRERLKDYLNVEIVHADILAFDFSSAIHSLTNKKVKVIGNIPYYISSQILFRLIDYRSDISCMILMFQKELADRLTAGPGTKKYGIPSVIVGMYTICTREMIIPAVCFYPAPKIISAVLKMVVRDTSQIDLNDHKLFFKIVRIAFSKRRKTLLNNLKSLTRQGYNEKDINQALQISGIDGSRRGETLSAVELGTLSNAFFLVKYS